MKLHLKDKLKLLLFKREEFYYNVRRILGVRPKDITLYRLALTDRSYHQCSHGRSKQLNNERLEFLGDSILDAVVSGILYRRFKHQNEGFLTTVRSKIVNRNNLNLLAQKACVDELLESSQVLYHHGRRSGTLGQNVLGNTLEAIIGAIYIDRGFYEAEKYICNKLLKPHVNLSRLAQKDDNFKSQLIEWGQRHKLEIEYVLVREFVDENQNPQFQTEVFIDGKSVDYGCGRSKKESEQEAARFALGKLKRLYPGKK